MSLVPELQRLLARGPGSLPDTLIVDVGAIARWAFETDPSADIWPTVIDVARRARGRLAWIVAETTLPSAGVVAATLNQIRAELERGLGSADVLRSDEPAPALLTAMLAAKPEKVGVVSAGLDERPHELWLFGDGLAAAMLDVASGRLWTRTLASELYGEPQVLPRLYALVGVPADAAPVVREAANYVAQLRDAAKKGLTFDAAEIPPRVKFALAQHKDAIDNRAAELRGDGRADAAARAWLRTWLTMPGRIVPIARTDTAYVLAEVARTGDTLEVKRVRVRVGDHEDAAENPSRALSLLRTTAENGPQRWFVPHALDVLGAMADHALPLPLAAMDPAYVTFAIDPDAPPSVTSYCGPALSLSSAAQRWLEDPKRETPFPQGPRDWHDLAEMLPVLDRDLSAALRQDSLDDLLETDIGPTLPVLAKIERRGAWVALPEGYPSWERIRQKLERRLEFLQRIFMPLFGIIDPYRTDFRELVMLLKKEYGKLPTETWSPDLSGEDEFNRYVARGDPKAVALARARSIESSSFYWLSLMQSAGGRIRGMHIPYTTGRWGFRAPPLHNLPKRSPEGKLLRSALRGPEGYELVAGDFNAFEARILAALSDDPILMAAASTPDMHAEMATRLSARFVAGGDEFTRDEAKLGVYALIYGQGDKGFKRRLTSLNLTGSAALYQEVESLLAKALTYRAQELQQFKKTGYVTTRGGWRRSPQTKRSAFNTLVQGLGADILRRVLRELDRQLVGTDAFIVHQAHDEVVVASRPECANAVAQILKATMKGAAMQTPSLLPRLVPLDVKVRRGGRWSDLL